MIFSIIGSEKELGGEGILSYAETKEDFKVKNVASRQKVADFLGK